MSTFVQILLESMKIFIAGLPFQVGEEELTAVFGDFGVVKSLRIVTDRETKQSKGFGFVEMPNDDEAREAIKNMDGADYYGRRISVAEADERQGSANRSGGSKRPSGRPERSFN